MKYLIAALITAFSYSSFATGETTCSMNLGDKKVDVSLLNSHTPGSSVLGGNSQVEIKGTTDASFTHKDMVGWWNSSHDLKIHFLKLADGADLFDTQLIIEATYSEVHSTYVGMAYYSGPQGAQFHEIIHCQLY